MIINPVESVTFVNEDAAKNAASPIDVIVEGIIIDIRRVEVIGPAIKNMNFPIIVNPLTRSTLLIPPHSRNELSPSDYPYNNSINTK